MTTRTAPPGRRSTCASGVSQPCSAWNQRRSTASLVQASKTASAGAGKGRSMFSVSPLIAPLPGGVAPPSRPMLSPPAARRRGRPPSAAAPPAASPQRGRTGSRAARAALRGGLVGEGLREDGGVAIFVVAVPPRVGLRLRIALRRGLPHLLAAQRGDVEGSPRAAQRPAPPPVGGGRGEDPGPPLA